jgi:hypothetical protein
VKLRLGRHNHRIVYLQDLDEATEQDPMVAVFFDAGQAGMLVQLANSVTDPRWWDVFKDTEL